MLKSRREIYSATGIFQEHTLVTSPGFLLSFQRLVPFGVFGIAALQIRGRLRSAFEIVSVYSS
jgi:hypothetical protein